MFKFGSFNFKSKNKRGGLSYLNETSNWHCGNCGISLDDDDYMCPMCGGGAVDENGNSR